MIIVTVGELTRRIKIILEGAFNSEPFWVSGEVSNFRGQNISGHTYFNLKDESAVLPVVLFSRAAKGLNFPIKEGMKILASGRLSVYEPHGRYQFIIDECRPAGQGELYLKFELTKKRLDEKGYFRQDRKRTLPSIPGRIGVITSPTGAAIRDVINGIYARNPHVQLLVFPVRVQGKEAIQEIADAIVLANEERFFLDVLIVARGGGSIEDLWAFNEEMVAEAIFNSRLPVISAVGHMTDYTIADFVADVRASTPANAAELVIDTFVGRSNRVEALRDRSIRAIRVRLAVEKNLLERRFRTIGFAEKQTVSGGYLRLDAGIEKIVRAMKSSSRMRGVQLDSIANRLGQIGYLVAEEETRLHRQFADIKRLVERRLLIERNSLFYSIRRLSPQYPRFQIETFGQRLDVLRKLIEGFLYREIERTSSRLASYGRVIETNRIENVLSRGYAVVRKNNQDLLMSAADIRQGERLTIRLHEGTIGARAEKPV